MSKRVSHGRITRHKQRLACAEGLLIFNGEKDGSKEQGEPGVFMAFEETAQELAENVASLGFDLEDLTARRQLFIDHVQLGRTQGGGDRPAPAHRQVPRHGPRQQRIPVPAR